VLVLIVYSPYWVMYSFAVHMPAMVANIPVAWSSHLSRLYHESASVSGAVGNALVAVVVAAAGAAVDGMVGAVVVVAAAVAQVSSRVLVSIVAVDILRVPQDEVVVAVALEDGRLAVCEVACYVPGGHAAGLELNLFAVGEAATAAVVVVGSLHSVMYLHVVHTFAKMTNSPDGLSSHLFGPNHELASASGAVDNAFVDVVFVFAVAADGLIGVAELYVSISLSLNWIVLFRTHPHSLV